MSELDSFSARGGWWVVAQALVLLCAAAIPVLTANAGLWPVYPLQWLGVALTAGGFFLAALSLIALGEAMTPFPAPRTEATLRTTGFYAWVRHPVYAGMVLGSFGWALWWLSTAGAAFTPVVFAFLDRKAAREEVWLRAKFPDYGTYQKRVKKLIPLVY